MRNKEDLIKKIRENINETSSFILDKHSIDECSLNCVSRVYRDEEGNIESHMVVFYNNLDNNELTSILDRSNELIESGNY